MKFMMLRGMLVAIPSEINFYGSDAKKLLLLQ